MAFLNHPKTEAEIVERRNLLAAQMEAEIDSLIKTRRKAGKNLKAAPYNSRLCGYGPRTLNCRRGYRKQTVWGIPAKKRAGIL